MIDQQIIDLLLAGIADYGIWALGFYLLLASAALPLPATPLMIAAGALARQGFFNWTAALTWSLIGVVLGDIVSYALGRFAGEWADRHIGQRFGEVWQKAQVQFNRYGGWAVFLSRWLLNSLDVPINLIAGASKYDFRRFFAYSVIGRLFWILLYGGLGYAVSSQYQIISQNVSQYAGWLGAIAVAALLIYILVRLLLRNRMQKIVAPFSTAEHSDSTD
jgi:membrane protein DedA with SNARE-associated domain